MTLYILYQVLGLASIPALAPSSLPRRVKLYDTVCIISDFLDTGCSWDQLDYALSLYYTCSAEHFSCCLLSV